MQRIDDIVAMSRTNFGGPKLPADLLSKVQGNKTDTLRV